jgi:hypothetical protein
VSFAILADDDDSDSDDESGDNIDSELSQEQEAPPSAKVEPENRSEEESEFAVSSTEKARDHEEFANALGKNEIGQYTPESVLKAVEDMEKKRDAHYAQIFKKIAETLGIGEDLVRWVF